MAEKKKQSAVARDLSSGNEETIAKALKKVRQKGDAESIGILLDLVLLAPNESIQQEALAILYDIKHPEASKYLFERIRSAETDAQLAVLISILWQAGLDAKEELPLLVQLAIKHDFEVCLECISVIEHMNGDFEDEVVLEQISDIQEAIIRNNKNQNLLAGLRDTLNSFVIDK